MMFQRTRKISSPRTAVLVPDRRGAPGYEDSIAAALGTDYLAIYCRLCQGALDEKRSSFRRLVQNQQMARYIMLFQ